MSVATPLIGRFGNQMFQYAYARARSIQLGVELHTPPWLGQRVFQNINDPPVDGSETEIFTGYSQTQSDLIYTRSAVREWFKFKPEIEAALEPVLPSRCLTFAHRRIGDYASCGYVVVSRQSYEQTARLCDLPPVLYFTEENPYRVRGFDGDLACIPDFYFLAHADFLLRGNSTFSWWAATLSRAKVFSPIIEGLEGGREQDCRFVQGNWPRLANLSHTTDLHLCE